MNHRLDVLFFQLVPSRKAIDARQTDNQPQAIEPDLLLVFGAVEHFTAAPLCETLRQAFPAAHLLGCSTAREITQDGVDDGTTFRQVQLLQA